MASRPALDLGAGRVRRVRSRHQRLVDRDRHFSRSLVRPLGRAQLPRECADARSLPRSTSRATSPTARCSCSFDWRRSEGEEWTIDVRTVDGRNVQLADGGAHLSIDGRAKALSGPGEYPDIYRQFVDLIDQRGSSVDVRPLRLVADCFLASGRRIVEPVAM